ncbi:MAG: MBL fold metallo-hydrolase [Gammaproteobacteria bacterium]|nr:MBL fold metallo-hydrolase [Gammaproteobacteria bacterium]
MRFLIVLRFCSLGSGSRGNGTLVSSGDACVLIDCGFSLRDLERRLGLAGVALTDITAILVTHEHADHAQGVMRAARASGAAVLATAGTWRGMRAQPRAVDRVIVAEEAFPLAGLDVLPVTVPHDAREPVQFVFEQQSLRLGVLTDLGHPSQHVVDRFRGCDGLLLEYNHDADMLRTGSYPPALKRRVGGDFGHLANAQASALLAALQPERLQVVLAGHLSEQNNTRELASQSLEEVMADFSSRRALADQQGASDWFEVC